MSRALARASSRSSGWRWSYETRGRSDGLDRGPLALDKLWFERLTLEKIPAAPLRALRWWSRLRERSQTKKPVIPRWLFDIVICQGHHSKPCANGIQTAFAPGVVKSARRTTCAQALPRFLLAAASLKHAGLYRGDRPQIRLPRFLLAAASLKLYRNGELSGQDCSFRGFC
jgi:hypothetical protein